MTKQELLEKLRAEEETLLLELLNISSDEIVDAFLHKVEERYKYISQQYEDQE